MGFLGRGASPPFRRSSPPLMAHSPLPPPSIKTAPAKPALDRHVHSRFHNRCHPEPEYRTGLLIRRAETQLKNNVRPSSLPAMPFEPSGVCPRNSRVERGKLGPP